MRRWRHWNCVRSPLKVLPFSVNRRRCENGSQHIGKGGGGESFYRGGSFKGKRNYNSMTIYNSFSILLHNLNLRSIFPRFFSNCHEHYNNSNKLNHWKYCNEMQTTTKYFFLPKMTSQKSRWRHFLISL